MSRTIFYDDFDVNNPGIHPGTGDLMITYTVGEDRHVYPIPKEDAEAYYEAIGKTLGKKGADIVMPTGADIHAFKPR